MEPFTACGGRLRVRRTGCAWFPDGFGARAHSALAAPVRFRCLVSVSFIIVLASLRPPLAAYVRDGCAIARGTCRQARRAGCRSS